MQDEMPISEALEIILKSYKRDLAYNQGHFSHFICIRANDLAWDGEITADAAYAIREHIEQLIGGDSTLQDWLIVNGHVEGYDVFDTEEGQLKLQATRIAWLNDMIEYFKAVEFAEQSPKEVSMDYDQSFIERTVSHAKDVFKSAVAKITDSRN